MKFLLKSLCFIFLSFNLHAIDALEADIAEKDINAIFKKALMGAAAQLDRTSQVNPFAVVIKPDGEVGVFGLAMNSEKNKDLSVEQRVAHIRGLLQAAAGDDSITGYCQVMYIVVEQDGNRAQGLSFEIEHKMGVSIQRFLPVEVNEETGKIHLVIEQMATNNKPKLVFVDS